MRPANGRFHPVNALLEEAAQHWRFVSPLLVKPSIDADDDRLAALLDEVLSLTRGEAGHELAGLASTMGDLLAAYDDEHRPMPPVAGIEALRYLMEEHGAGPEDSPEIGPARAVVDVLTGVARLEVPQARALGLRFALPPTSSWLHDRLRSRPAGRADLLRRSVVALRRAVAPP